MGYFLFATEDISKGTVLCEYCGEISFSNAIQNEVLSLGKFPVDRKQKEVVIVTDTYANEGRFVSDVSKRHLDKTNRAFDLYVVNGVIKCLILLTNDVIEGEIFYAYYGKEYETVAKNFVYYRTYAELISQEAHQKIKIADKLHLRNDDS